MNTIIKNSITKASKVVGKTWPLHTFVASNPLSGYENLPFQEAVQLAAKHFNARNFPKANQYEQALIKGQINREILINLLKENDLYASPEEYLNRMNTPANVQKNENHDLDIYMSKWLSSFMDEGLAEWDMPYKGRRVL